MKVDWYRTISTIVESDVSASAKAVMVCLLNYRNRKTGLCFPSMTTIADGSGLKTTAVKKALSDLKESGFVEWESKVPKMSNSKVNHYSLLFVWSLNDHMDVHMEDHMDDHITNQSANQSGDRSEYDHEPIGTNKNQEKQKPLAPPEPDAPEKPKSEFSGACPAANKNAALYHPKFEEFWNVSPCRPNGSKGSKFNAFKAWWSAMRGKVLTPDEIIGHMVRLAPTYGQYPKDVERWVKGAMWQGEAYGAPRDPSKNRINNIGKIDYGEAGSF